MPAPVVSRLNKITYYGVAVGSTTNYQLHGPVVIEHDYTSKTISFQVFVNHDTAATFNSLCATLEDAYRQPNDDFTLKLGSNTVYSFTQGGNPARNAIPSIRKVGGGADSNNSRLYECSITWMMEADESGKNGRQSAQVTVTQDGSEAQHADVSAVYTFVSNGTAFAQATTNFPTYTAAALATLGGTWDEFSSITYSRDDENNICRAHASYKEILSAQSQVATNDTTLHGVWTEVATDRVGIGADPGGSAPLMKVSVRFSCTVRSSVTTDLKTTYESIVRPHMLAIAQSHTLASQITAISERPGLRLQDNTINARMVFLAPDDNSFIRSDTNVAKNETLPFFFVPVLDGKPFSRDRHNKPGFKGAAVVSTVLVLGTSEKGGAGSTPFASLNEAVRTLVREGYHITEKQEPTFKRVEFDGMNLAGSTRLSLLAIKRVVLLEFAKVRPSGQGGGGGGTRVRPRMQFGGHESGTGLDALAGRFFID